MKYLKLLVSMALMFSVSMCAQSDNQNQVEQQESACHINKEKIQIFGYADCRYCQKVLHFIVSQPTILQANEIEFIDILASENSRALLLSLAGKTQVPYLVDKAAGVAMHESDDIIAYLMKKYGIEYAPVVTVTQAVQEEQTQKSYNPATFLSDIAQSTKPVVILVSTTWCNPCQFFKPIFLEVAQQFAQDCNFICVDGNANSEIVEQLGIFSYPSVVCFKDGKKIVPENYRSQQGLSNVVMKLLQNN